MNRSRLKTFASSRAGLATGLALGAAAATAVWVEAQARRAEREHPPTGSFVEIQGVPVHYIERGEGPAVVLIHGNMLWSADFQASGLIDRLAQTHRVIAFDRPGFGHSPRPRDRLWTVAAQAALLRAAIQRLGLEQAVVVGHSMGAVVALTMALDHPELVSALVLMGGYYYPGARIDALLAAPVALPLIGDVMRYTVSAVSTRLLLGRAVAAMFRPNEVPAGFFAALSREMLLRPAQLRADAQDAAFMIPAAAANRARHRDLCMPLTIVAGQQDRVVDAKAHALRLHAELGHSRLLLVPQAGHMVHHTNPQEVLAAIEQAGTAAAVKPGGSGSR